jgi:tetratricopeptide (TPR) repeat protein
LGKQRSKNVRGSASSRTAAVPWLPAVLIVVAAAVAYANSLGGPFIFDDSSSILENASIAEPGHLAAVLSPPHETPVAGRPLVNLTFAANVALTGRSVTGFHVVNIAIHIACALLLFGVLRRTLADESPLVPAVVALLWAVHPLNTEAVNYLSQRTELLMALCLMGTLYASVRGWTIVAIVACALGMAAKESMVVAPLLVVAYDRVFRYRSWRDAWAARGRFYLALAATWLILGWLVAGGGRSESAGFSAYDANAWVYLLNQTEIITRYLRLAVWPVGLAIDYGTPRALTLIDVWPFALGLTLLAVATMVALMRSPRVGFLGLWLFVTLAPASSIVPIPTEVGAERRMYLPLMAVICLLVVAAAALWKKYGRPDVRVAIGATSVLVLACTSLTWARNAEYGSALTLTETTVARYPTPAAESMYGTELAAAGRLLEAEPHLRRATSGYPPAHYYLATVLAARGEPAAALTEFESFVASQPPTLAQVKTARLMMADLHERAGRLPEAVAQYRALLAVYADDVNVLQRLAAAEVRQSHYDEAIATYQRLLVLEPDAPAVLNGVGVALVSAGRVDEAIAMFQRVVDLAPDRPGARENLARALAMRGK